MSNDYALAPALRARFMGIFLVVVGIVVCAMTVLVLELRLSLNVLSAVVLLTLAAVFAVGYVLTRRAYVVRTDAAGYQVRFVRGVGVSAARWGDVEDLVTAEVAGSPCVVLRLRDGRTTTIPVELLAEDREQFVRELRERLSQGARKPGPR